MNFPCIFVLTCIFIRSLNIVTVEFEDQVVFEFNATATTTTATNTATATSGARATIGVPDVAAVAAPVVVVVVPEPSSSRSNTVTTKKSATGRPLSKYLLQHHADGSIATAATTPTIVTPEMKDIMRTVLLLMKVEDEMEKRNTQNFTGMNDDTVEEDYLTKKKKEINQLFRGQTQPLKLSASR
mmetsp:Transcript_11357/g.12864  ORF Transcript_11357/g.12864 Transcript_11357/m.12864 type:complete len:184 (+) Transcript_11357:368-919(+)